MTVPNLLSLLRMGLTPLFLISVVNGQPVQALAIFAFAGVTDALDGFIARAFGQQSRLGTFLDPIADKLLLMSAYVVLAIPGMHGGVPIPVWVTVMVIARDLIIVIVALILNLASGVSRFPPSWLSKINTTVQVATALLVLASAIWGALEFVASWAIWAVVVTTGASGVDYILRASRMPGDRRDDPVAAPGPEPPPA